MSYIFVPPMMHKLNKNCSVIIMYPHEIYRWVQWAHMGLKAINLYRYHMTLKKQVLLQLYDRRPQSKKSHGMPVTGCVYFTYNYKVKYKYGPNGPVWES